LKRGHGDGHREGVGSLGRQGSLRTELAPVSLDETGVVAPRDKLGMPQDRVVKR
jgi:hypothetical protein